MTLLLELVNAANTAGNSQIITIIVIILLLLITITSWGKSSLKQKLKRKPPTLENGK